MTETTDVPLVRLLSMAVTVALEELHDELAQEGHTALRPSHGYALNAVMNGYDTTSKLAPLLGMTKQGAAKLVQTLIDGRYLEFDPAGGEDARTKPLVLTTKGHDVVVVSVGIQRRIDAKWAALVGPHRMSVTRAVLEQAVRAARDGDLPAIRLAW